MLVADPHMYLTEVRFYERIRPSLRCETPAVFGFGIDEDTNRFAVVIEDLGLRHARFPSALSGLTADDVAPLMTTFAELHAPNWGRDDLASEFPWLETTTAGKTARWWIEESRHHVERELKEPYKAAAFDVAAHSLDRVYAAYARLQEVNDAAPLTVVHGDTHIGNSYLVPDGGGLLDWQLMRIANWGNDVGYLIMTALDVGERRKGEQDLLRLYLSELGRLGVDPPGWDETWTLYRQQMVWGILAWIVTPTAMYDQPLLDTLIRRCTVAADDLDTYRLLDA
jgi:aminoglycoside phosphotransferase (APT) family kinase protein